MTETPTGDAAGPRAEPPSPPPAEPTGRPAGLERRRRHPPASRRHPPTGDADGTPAAKRRRRGSRGGRNRSRPRPEAGAADGSAADDTAATTATRSCPTPHGRAGPSPSRPPTPRWCAGRPPRPARKPQIGDSMPAPARRRPGRARGGSTPDTADGQAKRRRRRGGRGRGGGGGGGQGAGGAGQSNRSDGGKGRKASPVQAVLPTGGLDLDDDILEARRGRERKGRPVGRYLMCVHVDPKATQIAVLEGRNLIEHYVSRPSDDVAQIHGNIYLGRVQNVLPGMEAAFVDIGTPKNAVLYRGDVHFDADDVEGAPKGKTEQPPHRADAEGQADDHLPGHQEPDRRQGRPPHPGGVAARAGSWC